MGKTTVVCSRCNKIVRGMEGPGYTAGFYRNGPDWGKYMRPGEAVLCDDCMRTEPRFLIDYPKSWENMKWK